jgi:hypothetical protein
MSGGLPSTGGEADPRLSNGGAANPVKKLILVGWEFIAEWKLRR